MEIIGFYKNLMGSATDELTMVNKMVVANGPSLNIAQQRMLNADCSAMEVKEALFGMDSNRAPGIDGYNAYFFKKCWHIIGEEVTTAIQLFFQTRVLPPEVNVTLLTLIPKCDNACAVRDFRPIACCPVLYKIISKILASRMRLVLDSIISQNQSALVQGKQIFDNILLSHELVKGYSRKHLSPRCMVKVDIQKAYDSVE